MGSLRPNQTEYGYLNINQKIYLKGYLLERNPIKFKFENRLKVFILISNSWLKYYRF